MMKGTYSCHSNLPSKRPHGCPIFALFPLPLHRFEENMCLATRNEDKQWSSYVYWVAQALVYAEERGIDQRSSNEMPLVKLFGFERQRAFRDAIHAVGNYEEVYSRHLQSILPRGGRNRLNLKEEGRAPLRYLPPSRLLDVHVSE